MLGLELTDPGREAAKHIPAILCGVQNAHMRGFTVEEWQLLKSLLRRILDNAQAIQATIDKKTIRAPFNGRLGIRQINLGQYLNPGQAVVPLQSRHPVYVDFAVPQQEIQNVRVGNPLTVKLEGDSGAALRYRRGGHRNLNRSG